MLISVGVPGALTKNHDKVSFLKLWLVFCPDVGEFTRKVTKNGALLYPVFGVEYPM